MRGSPLDGFVLAWLRPRKRRYTPAQAVSRLKGRARYAPVPWAANREPTYGALADRTSDEIEEALGERVRLGLHKTIRGGTGFPLHEAKGQSRSLFGTW